MDRYLELFKTNLKQIKKSMEIKRTKAVDEALSKFNTNLVMCYNWKEEQ